MRRLLNKELETTILPEFATDSKDTDDTIVGIYLKMETIIAGIL